MLLNDIKKCDDNKPYVFVSYSSRDAETVWGDVLEFQKRGYNVWLDEKNLVRTKDSWKKDAMEAIADMYCKLVVFYVSENSLTSEACLGEMMKTKSDEAKMLHEEEVPFIAVDVEPVGNIIEFKKKVHKQIVETDALEKPEKIRKIKVMSEFIEKFFNSNNERVRIHDRTDESDASCYYQEILNCFPPETRIAESETGEKSLEGDRKTQTVEQPKATGAENAENASADYEAVRAEQDAEVVRSEEKPTGKTEKDTAKRGVSNTGDITYTLYGETYTENQSDMMLRFFAQVLKRHQEIVNDLPEYKGMNCVSEVDYTNAANITGEMPSYFRVCRYFRYENGSGICVGTSYDVAGKLKKMALLLQIVGEDPSVFSSSQVELPGVKVKMEKGTLTKQDGYTDMSFRIYGESFQASQVDMLGIVFSKMIAKHSDRLEEIAENCTCVDLIDYSAVEKNERPCYFKSSFNVYEVNGMKYSVGGGFSLKEKLRLIGKLIDICGETAESVVIEGEELSISKSAAGKRNKEEKYFL